MNFEAKFPSLKNKHYLFLDTLDRKKPIEDIYFHFQSEIRACCLDKQRVREAINKLPAFELKTEGAIIGGREFMLKELGLEDE